MLIGRGKVRFKAARSSGPGGQRANRRSTKVQLWVRVGDLPFTLLEKRRIRGKLKNFINHNDEIEVVNEEERSQESNRDKAFQKLNELLKDALKVKKPRFQTVPPRRAEDKRIKEKKLVSEKKKSRRKIEI